MRVTESLSLAASNARKVVDAFRAAGALSGGRARLLTDLRLNNSAALRELVQAKVVRKAGADRYYLDEAVWAQRRRLAVSTILRFAVPLVLALLAALFYWGGR